MTRTPRVWPVLLAALLCACGSKPDTGQRIASLDDELTGANANSPAKDPAVTAALHDQIMVDPDLLQQSNAGAVRPPPRPVSGALPSPDIAAKSGPAETETLRHAPPATADCKQCAAARRALTLGALAERTGAPATCTAAIGYSASWSTKLPAAVPLYPDARVTEAAGADGRGCTLRVVSFRSSAAIARVLDWYYTRTTKAGYSAQHGVEGAQHSLGGTKPGGGAFLVMLRPRGDGTDVDLMVDAGA